MHCIFTVMNTTAQSRIEIKNVQAHETLRKCSRQCALRNGFIRRPLSWEMLLLPSAEFGHKLQPFRKHDFLLTYQLEIVTFQM